MVARPGNQGILMADNAAGSGGEGEIGKAG